MSVSSNGSCMSVTFQNDDVPLEECLDEIFMSLQGFLNTLHMDTRTMSQLDDRNEDYEFQLNHILKIGDIIDDMSDLFRELKAVSRQVIGKPPKGEEIAMKKLVEDHKLARKMEKATLATTTPN